MRAVSIMIQRAIQVIFSESSTPIKRREQPADIPPVLSHQIIYKCRQEQRVLTHDKSGNLSADPLIRRSALGSARLRPREAVNRNV